MRRSNRVNPPTLAHQRFSRHFLPWIMLLSVLIMVGLACNLPSLANPASIRNMTLAQALAVTSRDDRQEILKRMGRPDTFKLTFATLDSKVVRYE